MKQDLQNMLTGCNEELDDLEKRINSLSVSDKGRIYYTNYALMKSCGTVEFVYRSIVADYFSQLSDARIDKYLETTIRNGSMSATYDNMSMLLGKFDDKWKTDFQKNVNQHVNGKKMIGDAKSLVNNRHLFAHGKTPTATFLDIKNYYNGVVILINIFNSVVQ